MGTRHAGSPRGRTRGPQVTAAAPGNDGSFYAASEALYRINGPTATRISDNGSGEELLARRVHAANARIHEMSQAEEEHAGMGTTITAAHVGAHDVAIAHVGDSRATACAARSSCA